MKNNGFIDEIEEETELDKKYNDLVNYYKVFKYKNLLDQNFIELNNERFEKIERKIKFHDIINIIIMIILMIIFIFWR